MMLQARRLGRSRKETAFSPKWTAGSSEQPNSLEVLPAFRVRGADRRWGFGASCGLKVVEKSGRLSHHRASPRLDQHQW